MRLFVGIGRQLRRRAVCNIASARRFRGTCLKDVEKQNGSLVFSQAANNGSFECRGRSAGVDNDGCVAGALDPNTGDTIIPRSASEDNRLAMELGNHILGNLDVERLFQPIAKECGVLNLAVPGLRSTLP